MEFFILDQTCFKRFVECLVEQAALFEGGEVPVTCKDEEVVGVPRTLASIIG